MPFTSLASRTLTIGEKTGADGEVLSQLLELLGPASIAAFAPSSEVFVHKTPPSQGGHRWVSVDRAVNTGSFPLNSSLTLVCIKSKPFVLTGLTGSICTQLN